jgi:phage shock protein E
MMNVHCVTIPATIVAFLVISSPARSADLTKDSLPTVQKNITEKKAVLVDVREKSEWDKGHVEGAIFLPLSGLQTGIDPTALAKQVPKDKIIYTHCVVGKRSLTAADILERSGYQVRPLKAGYKELVAAGFKKAEDPASK